MHVRTCFAVFLLLSCVFYVEIERKKTIWVGARRLEILCYELESTRFTVAEKNLPTVPCGMNTLPAEVKMGKEGTKKKQTREISGRI